MSRLFSGNDRRPDHRTLRIMFEIERYLGAKRPEALGALDPEKWLAHPVIDLTSVGVEAVDRARQGDARLSPWPQAPFVYFCIFRDGVAFYLHVETYKEPIAVMPELGAARTWVTCSTLKEDDERHPLFWVANGETNNGKGIIPKQEVENREKWDVIRLQCTELMRYLTSCPEHLVEVAREAPPTPREIKTRKTKPWASPLFRRVILLDPTKATLYGHRIDRGGAHASPHPHQRRGHWATLRADRYGDNRGKQVWRRPAWVGDREWVFEGNRYKVVTAEVPS